MVHFIPSKYPLFHFVLLFGAISLTKSSPLTSTNLSIADLKDSPPDFEDPDDRESVMPHSNRIHFKQLYQRCQFDYDPCEGRTPACSIPPTQWNCAPDRYWEFRRRDENMTLNLACKNMTKKVEDLRCTDKCEEQGECDSLCYSQCSCGELDWSENNIREYSPRALTFEDVKYCYHIRIALVDLMVGMLQCIKHDSQLASIRNWKENDLVIGLIKLKLAKMREKNPNGSIHFLIGHRIFRDPKNGEIISMVNTDGSPTTYGWSIINGTKWIPKHITSPWYSTIDGPMEPNNNDTFSTRGPTPRWENCVSIEFKENGTYGWSDRPCDSMRFSGFVCKQRIPRNLRKKKSRSKGLWTNPKEKGREQQLILANNKNIKKEIEKDKMPILVNDHEEYYYGDENEEDYGTGANQIPMPEHEYREVGSPLDSLEEEVEIEDGRIQQRCSIHIDSKNGEGSITFGQPNRQNCQQNGWQYTPVSQRGFWQFGTTGFSIGSHHHNQFQQAILLESIPFILGQIDDINRLTIELGPSAGFSELTRTVIVGCKEFREGKLPNVTFHIGNEVDLDLVLAPEDYVDIDGAIGDICPTYFAYKADFYKTNVLPGNLSGINWIFGRPIMSKYCTSYHFDLRNIGFTLAKKQ